MSQLCYECRSYNATNVAVYNATNAAAYNATNVRSEISECPVFPDNMDFPNARITPKFSNDNFFLRVSRLSGTPRNPRNFRMSDFSRRRRTFRMSGHPRISHMTRFFEDHGQVDFTDFDLLPRVFCL